MAIAVRWRSKHTADSRVKNKKSWLYTMNTCIHVCLLYFFCVYKNAQWQNCIKAKQKNFFAYKKAAAVRLKIHEVIGEKMNEKKIIGKMRQKKFQMRFG